MIKKIFITTDYITLAQFLKFAGIISNGGEAKGFLMSEEVKVNKELENRRGRKLYPGYFVEVDGRVFVIKRNED